MPSPFPGMNPYLENPAYWSSFHNSLMTYLAEQLNTTLPPGYRASPEERVYIEPPGRGIYPDVAVLTKKHTALPDAQSGSVAIADVGDTPEILTLLSGPVKEIFLKIISMGTQRRVVTIIELLSPANKAAGSRGHREYLQKQREILESDVNLLEIDLHRTGAHSVAAPREDLLEYGHWDYLACLSRAVFRDTFEFWRNGVRNRLPLLRVPLLDGEPDTQLNLQASLHQTYNALRLAEEIDYALPPSPPLVGEDAVWMDALLREMGLRGTL